MRCEKIGRATLYLGDCREIIPTLSGIDAVVTDPPYGIGFNYATHDDSLDGWFTLMNGVVPLLRACAPFVVMPSCAVQRLPWWYENHQPDWVIAWHKGSPGHASKVGFNDWEPHVSWGRPKRPMHDHFSTRCGFDPNGHPCPKPIEWAKWLVARAVEPGATVLDAFMGSGTTGHAAVNMDRQFVGIELDPTYFDIACRRIEQAQRQGDLFIEGAAA
jgi:site-specific DNA-methyltransferase (adenine-specific)/modification methylase